MAKAAMNKTKTLFTNEFDLTFLKQVKFYTWNVALFGAETWTLQNVRRPQTPCKFCSVLLERDGDQLDRSCEK
jgi:hypothetical protein